MNYRHILEKYKEKLELASRGNSKELRLNKAEIQELYQAMVSLLLANAELTLKNQELLNPKQNKDESNEDVALDGGGFK